MNKPRNQQNIYKWLKVERRSTAPPPRPKFDFDLCRCGYDKELCLQTYPTYNNLRNVHGYREEYILDKIETIDKLCSRVGSFLEFVNDELYHMHIDKDASLGWRILLAVHSICFKLCTRYSTYTPLVDNSMQMNSTLQYVNESKLLLKKIKYASRWNERRNLNPKKLNLIIFLLQKSYVGCDKYLQFIALTHRNIEAE